MHTHLHTVPYLKSLPLAHPVTGHENFDISILIGADYCWQFIEDHTVRGNGPTAVKSKLGYLLSGPLQLPQPMTTSSLHVAIFHSTSHPTHDHPGFWQSESSTDEHMQNSFLQQYMNTHITVRPDGVYSLCFPWKENHPPLPSNFSMCSR